MDHGQEVLEQGQEDLGVLVCEARQLEAGGGLEKRGTQGLPGPLQLTRLGQRPPAWKGGSRML